MKNLSKLIQSKFEEMELMNGILFRANIPGELLWETYLSSFDKKDDPIFRDPNSSEHNCRNCKNFIVRYGNIVSLDENYNIVSMFDIILEENNEYYKSIKKMSELIHSATICDVFIETFNNLNSLPYEKCKPSNKIFRLGLAKNFKIYTPEEVKKYGVVKEGITYEFNHLHLDILDRYIDKSGYSIGSIVGEYRARKEVFTRSMIEIPIDIFNLAKDLIDQDSILNGKSYLDKLNLIIKYKEIFDNLDKEKRDNWCWLISSKNPNIAKFKNELIGVFCTELASGKDLESTCLDWNKRADPINYMKVKSPITEKQINEAKKFVEDNNYEASFYRRCATIDDIKASEILHLSSDESKIKKISIFDNISTPTSLGKLKVKDFEKCLEVGIEEFMENILPKCKSVEALFLSSQKNNLVTLTTSDKESKPIFKWSNNYSWDYIGGLAGKSLILSENVKKAGGNIDAYLRFSIMWNESGKDIVDFDAHATQPDSREIYFSNYKLPRKTSIGGCLDIDMIRPRDIGIENIFWKDKKLLMDGKYDFRVYNYDGGRNNGLKAEIVIGDESFYYEINKEIKRKLSIASLELKDGELVNITNYINPISSSINIEEEIYGLKTNRFQKVNLICLSPNYWKNNHTGNKHYFFMLEGAKADDKITGFHTEFLNSELVPHRKVMEILSRSIKIDSTDNQLTGLGFNSTIRDELIVRIDKDNSKKVIKIKF